MSKDASASTFMVITIEAISLGGDLSETPTPTIAKKINIDAAIEN